LLKTIVYSGDFNNSLVDYVDYFRNFDNEEVISELILNDYYWKIS